MKKKHCAYDISDTTLFFLMSNLLCIPIIVVVISVVVPFQRSKYKFKLFQNI